MVRWDFSVHNHYNHSPILHGPSLMLLTGLTFKAFGDSIGVGRGMVATFSLIALAAAAALWPRRYRGWLFPLIATSPYLLYYSRFLRNEMIFCALVLVGLVGFVKSMQGRSLERRAAWGVLGTGPIIALLAFKENAIFVMATGLTFAVVWALKRLLWRRTALSLRVPQSQLRKKHGSGCKAARRPFTRLSPEAMATLAGWCSGIVIGMAYVLFIYGVTTTDRTFSPLQNIRASIDYWRGQQSEHRISGALHYHLVIMLVYELPILLMLALGLILDAVRRPMRFNIYMLSIAGWLFVWWCWSAIGRLPGPLGGLQNFLHLEPNLSLLVLGL